MAWRRKSGKPILKDKDGHYMWYEGLKIRFKDPEYRIHPLMGHQVRSRHTFVPVKPTEQPATGHAHQKATLKPYELDPAFRDPQELSFGVGDLMGIKQYPVTLEVEEDYPEVDFTGVKSGRMRHAVEILEFRIGFNHKTNKHVLYSPLAYNARWDTASQALWLRSIGMTPKNISLMLDTPYDTVKTWMRIFKDKPVIKATAYDWGTGYREAHGDFRLFGKASSLDAPKREYTGSGEKGVNINPVTGVVEDDR